MRSMTLKAVNALRNDGDFRPLFFAGQFGLKQIHGGTCVRRLLGRLCLIPTRGYYTGACDCLQNFGMDHVFAFRDPSERTGALTAIVWFPYGHVPPRSRNLLEWARGHDLNVAVLPQNVGWYGNGTNMVVVWRKWDLEDRHLHEAKVEPWKV